MGLCAEDVIGKREFNRKSEGRKWEEKGKFSRKNGQFKRDTTHMKYKAAS